jgi:GntR family transcriptional regulator
MTQEPGLSSSRPAPMYEQAAAALEAEIRSGKLGADERLLSERALAERLNVSRITIRRALARLAEKDLVRSSERSGWFTVPVSHGSNAMISFTDQGRQRGFAVTSRVLRCAVREATLEEADELGVAPGSDVCDLARIRCFDGLPIATTSAIVPLYLAPGLADHDFSTRSLYDVLRTEYRVLPSRGQFAIQAMTGEPPVTEHLSISRGDPVLFFSQTGYDQLGRAFELARTIYRADRYLFRGTLVAAAEGETPVIHEVSPRPGLAATR